VVWPSGKCGRGGADGGGGRNGDERGLWVERGHQMKKRWTVGRAYVFFSTGSDARD
jgi:hypothetical protein